MNRFLPALALISMVLVTSCGQVRTLTPIIEETETSLQPELEGVWKIGDGIFHIRFTDSNLGQFAWIEERGGEFEMGRGELHAMLREDDDEVGYLSLRILEEDEDQEGYVFAAFKILPNDSLVVWNAGPLERYESLLEEEGLEGEFKKGRHSSEAFFVDGPGIVPHIGNLKDFFELEEPAMLTRVLSEAP